MTAVGNVPNVPRNVVSFCSCHLVRLSKKALFAPKKSVIGPKLDLFSTIFLILSTSYLGPTTRRRAIKLTKKAPTD